jgi:hypothetical protein
MNVVERVKGIILKPAEEWRVIEGESGNVQYLFVNYVAILALIPLVCGVIGTSLVGVSLPGGGTLRVGFGVSLVTMIVLYLLTFVIVYVLALIIDGLSSRFGGQPHFENALKLSVYSYTPFWLAGIFALHPSLSFLGILGLYGFYLLYVGVPVLMKVPRERALIYCIAVVACGIVIWFLVSLIPIAILR